LEVNIIKKETEYIFQGEDEEEKVIISLSNDCKKVHIKFFDNPVDAFVKRKMYHPTNRIVYHLV